MRRHRPGTGASTTRPRTVARLVSDHDRVAATTLELDPVEDETHDSPAPTMRRGNFEPRR